MNEKCLSLMHDPRFMLFAGTAEGRRMCLFMMKEGLPVNVYTATDYGAKALYDAGVKVGDQLCVYSGRLDDTRLREEIAAVRPLAVIDATHPYAESISKSLGEICSQEDVLLLRLLRTEDRVPDEPWIFRVPDTKAAADFLRTREGNIFLTIGVKGLGEFVSLPRKEQRLCARVLPTAESIKACETAGIARNHIMAAEGPFDEEMNLACIKKYGAEYLVTKETGIAGGYPEKLSAAKKAGIKVVSIRRPAESGGMTEAEVQSCVRALWDGNERRRTGGLCKSCISQTNINQLER